MDRERSYDKTIYDGVHTSLLEVFPLLGKLGIVPRFTGKIETLVIPSVSLVHTEFVEGERLRDFIKGGKLPPDEITRVYQLIARKMGFLARHRILFGHLHDLNVVIRNSDHEPIIIDWEYGKLMDTPQDVESIERGTRSLFPNMGSASLLDQLPKCIEGGGYDEWQTISETVKKHYWESFDAEFHSIGSSIYAGKNETAQIKQLVSI